MFNEFLLKAGIISYEEYGIRSLPRETQAEMRKDLQTAQSITVSSDPNQSYAQQLKIAKKLELIEKKYKGINGPMREVYKNFVIPGNNTLFGYRPAGTQIWNYFPNPFGVFAFLSENYWAMRSLIDIVRTEMDSDGFVLKSAKGVSRKRLMQVHKMIRQLNIPELRTELAIHLITFGNAWVLPHKNLLKGTGKLELLYPNRLYPVFDRNTEEIVEWIYLVGTRKIVYRKDELLHIRFHSTQAPWMGSPPILPAITDIEADLHAAGFNNNVFKSNGTIGTILSIEEEKENKLPGASNFNFIEALQDKIESVFAGTKKAQGIVALPNVKGVHQISKPGELEANFVQGREMTAKHCAFLLGIPSEKIGINRSDSQQYQAVLVEDAINSQFDKTINRLTSKVDAFLNKLLREQLGITDVKIEAAGRYGAFTKTATEAIKTLADAGPVATVNEVRKKILGWEELPHNDPRGLMCLDNSPNRDKEAKPPMKGQPVDDPDLEELANNSIEKDLFNGTSFYYGKDCYTIHIGGLKDGQTDKTH